MVSKTAIPVLVAGMLLTGISNSLFNKWQDMQCVERCDDSDNSRHVEFSQPVWQTATMFLGECLCLLPVFVMHLYQRWVRQKWTVALQKGRTNPYEALRTTSSDESRSLIQNSSSDAHNHESEELLPPPRLTLSDDGLRDPHEDGEDLTGTAVWLFFGPAACDICGTTLMNVGLLFTPVSIYQMTRGALVLWVGIFSVIFLRRTLHLFQWLSLVTVVLGVCVVGLSGTLVKSEPTANVSHTLHGSGVSPEVSTSIINAASLGQFRKGDEELPEAVGALFGVLLILFAQIFTASQFVLEEKIMAHYSVEPLMAVGYEGLFGLSTTLAVQVVMHFLYGRTKDGRGGYFDMSAGWNQIIHTPTVFWTSFAIALSIALFNFFGLSVTRNISATARSTIDTCRTLGIWVVSLTLGWEVFKPFSGGLQVVGFALLCYGTLVFNAVIRPPKFLRPRRPHSRRARSRSRSRARSHLRRSQTAPNPESLHASVTSASTYDNQA